MKDQKEKKPIVLQELSKEESACIYGGAIVKMIMYPGGKVVMTMEKSK